MSVQNYNHHNHNHRMRPIEIKTPHTNYAHETPKDTILISKVNSAYNTAMIEIQHPSYPTLNPFNKHKYQTCTLLSPEGETLKLDANSQIFVCLQSGEIRAIKTSEGPNQLKEGTKLKITQHIYSEGNKDRTYKLITPDGLDSISSKMELDKMQELFIPDEYDAHCVKLKERAKTIANMEKCTLGLGGILLALCVLDKVCDARS